MLIFEKALDEPKYSSMYAQLCKRLNENAPNLEPAECKITTFKRLLLSKCKDEFENRAAISAAYEKRAGELTNDEEEARFVAKRKMLGNIKFIGELGKLEMLHDSILHRCCEQLLVGRRKQSIVDQTEDIECLAHLMKTCGRILDSAKARQLMDQYFDRIQALINNPDIQTRIRFLLQDVVELRNNHWKPRKLTSPDGPRTIQQVREDAARDGCIYLPQQDSPPNKAETATNKLEEVIFSKIRPKGMEDIFGAPGDLGMSLGMGPGVIPGVDNNEYGGGYSNSNNGYHNDGYENGGYRGRSSGPSFEEKFRETNNSYNNNDRGDYRDNYKKPRDSFESKFAERPDFGDRFTANRNKTHPSNRGRGRGSGQDMDRRSSPQFESRSQNGAGAGGQSVKDLPPRFNRMNMNNNDLRDPPPLRPSNNMMFKPKTPFSLPKSAMARPDSMNSGPSAKMDKIMMTTKQPPVIIQKPSASAKKQQEKKNQGPTRDEVFGKVDSLLEKLYTNDSTNEAFTSWKEAEIPAKMVNNALIHLFKRILKNNEAEQRRLAMDLVDQLFQSELITAVQVKETLVKLASNIESSSDSNTTVAEVSAWAVLTDKLKLNEMSEITEGGSSHPLFFVVLQLMAGKDKEKTLHHFKTHNVKLMEQLPTNMRSEEQLGQLLEQRELSFLLPLLAIKADMWKQLESVREPEAFMSWINNTVQDKHRKEPAFIAALIATIMKFITGESTLKNECPSTEKEDTEKEKEMVVDFKEVIRQHISNNQELQLAALYALQVFCFARSFPKGLLLRWFVSFYEADIVDERVFLKWKEDVNDNFPGKGKALFQVNQWLTWLEEAESEEEEEEED